MPQNDSRPARHANPEIVRLKRAIARETGMRDQARRTNHPVAMRKHDAAIIRLQQQLNAIMRKHQDVARNQPQHPARVGHQIPAAHRDRFGSVPITAENAARMVAHYRALLLALVTVVPFPLLIATRKAYTARLNEASRVLRSIRVHGGKTGHRKVNARRAELERLHSEQVNRAARLRAARRFAEADAAQRMAKNYHDQAMMVAAAETTPGVDWEQQAVSPYLADKAGVPTQQSPEEDGASIEASAKVDEDGASASLDVDLPWYRRYAAPLAIAAVVGIGLAVAGGKGGKTGASLRSVFVAKPSGLTVSRRTFATAK